MNYPPEYNFIMPHEGFESDHPSDPGRLTRHGVSLRWLETLPLELVDLDHDGDIDQDDLRLLTKEQAWGLFDSQIFEPGKFDLLPVNLSIAAKDFAVNASRWTATVVLQRAINRCGASLKTDGVIGTETLNAINTIKEQRILPWYYQERHHYYRKIVIKNPKLRAFHFGWTQRVLDLDLFIKNLGNGS